MAIARGGGVGSLNLEAAEDGVDPGTERASWNARFGVLRMVDLGRAKGVG